MDTNDKQPPSLMSDAVYGEEGNPLGLIKSFKQRLKECAGKSGAPAQIPQVTYLWICVSAEGIGYHDSPKAKRLSQEDWLAVIDEAASLGATWLVLSLSTCLSKQKGIWELCRWAQQAHGMMIGLHLHSGEVSPEEAAQIRTLDTAKVRLLVRSEWIESLQYLEDNGLELWTANPQEDGVKPHCQGPTRMIYVNAEGMLYTCGLVEGRAEYQMGHVLEERLGAVMSDSSLPHRVEEALHKVSSGCDGCPSLVANFFIANLSESA